MQRALLLLVAAYACLQFGTAQAKLITGSLPIHIVESIADSDPDICDPSPLDCGNATLTWSFDKHDNHSLEFAVDFASFSDLTGGPAGWAKFFGPSLTKFFDPGDLTGVAAWIAADPDNWALVTQTVTIWKPRRELLLGSDIVAYTQRANGIDAPFDFEETFFADLTEGEWMLSNGEGDFSRIRWNVISEVPEPTSLAVLVAGLVAFLTLGLGSLPPRLVR